MGLFLAKQYIQNEEEQKEKPVDQLESSSFDVELPNPLNRTWIERLVSIADYT